MKHISVGILTQSHVLSAGLSAILARLRDPAVSVTVYPTADDIAGSVPSLLFVDPAGISSDTLTSLRGGSRVVALYMSALPENVIRLFDDTISVYAHPSRIGQIVRDVAVETSGIDNRQELSPRERDVFVGIVKGLSNKEIASEINVSVNTVMTHRRNIAQKLQIHSPAGLTIYAIVKKLVRLEDVRSTIE